MVPLTEFMFFMVLDTMALRRRIAEGSFKLMFQGGGGRRYMRPAAGAVLPGGAVEVGGRSEGGRKEGRKEQARN